MNCYEVGAARRPPFRRRGRAAAVSVLAVFLGAAPLGAQTSGEPTSRPATGTIITIGGKIDNIARDSIQRRLDEALSQGATTIVFELHTPGGLATSALDICRTIKSVPAGVRTVAWVHPEAYSAGAMIALACHEIWMSPSSAIGDAAPISISSGGGLESLGKTERAKAESPILQEFRDSAARNGYDPLLARAMVTLGTDVWWLERTDGSGPRRFVTGDEKEKLVDNVAADKREWRPVESYALTVDGQRREFPVREPVVRADELLTLSQYDAVAFGFARGIAPNVPDLTHDLQLAAAPARLAVTGWEQFASWLNSAIVRGILLVIVLLGAYIEFHTPGVVVPGITALIALAIFLAAPYAAGMAGMWTVLLVVLGLVLIALELFVIPGFGLPGIAGALLLIAGLIGSFVPSEPGATPFSWPHLPGTWTALTTGLKVFTLSILVSLVGMVLLAQYLPRTRLAGGIVAANPAADAVVPAEAYPTVALGDLGVVTGDLRPGGQARFGHEVVDVQSQGEYVAAGRRVQVIRREGMNVIVRPLPDEAQA